MTIPRAEENEREDCSGPSTGLGGHEVPHTISPAEPAMGRRDWLARLGRPVAIAGLTLLATKLIVQSVQGGCISASSPCEQCRIHDGCRLPKAIEANRQAEAKKTSHSPDSRQG